MTIRFPSRDHVIESVGAERLIAALRKMVLIRQFEIRAESAYQTGKVGGFFHAYIGQEAVQTAAVDALGINQWWVASYRCHAIALLLGATPNELMAELYGKVTGNAMGRGGSMHFFTKDLLGGFGIVAGQLPIATGAAFAVKYRQKVMPTAPNRELAICFLGEGAVAQGSVHESFNIASLWDLPCIYVIENNQWGMGTHVSRALAMSPIAERLGPAYQIDACSADGMDYLSCYGAFETLRQFVLSHKRPVLIEVMTERFRGHSISDPAVYRSKEALHKCMERDPIQILRKHLMAANALSDSAFEAIEEEAEAIVIKSMQEAEAAPSPDPLTLEEGVLAP